MYVSIFSTTKFSYHSQVVEEVGEVRKCEERHALNLHRP